MGRRWKDEHADEYTQPSTWRGSSRATCRSVYESFFPVTSRSTRIERALLPVIYHPCTLKSEQSAGAIEKATEYGDC